MSKRRWIKRCKNRKADWGKWVEFRWGPITIGAPPPVMRRIFWDKKLQSQLRMTADQYRRTNKL